MRRSVLIPTGKQMKSYGCVRSLNRRGVHTVVASERDWIPVFASRYCSERRRIRSPWEDFGGYREDLLAIASRPDVEVVLPVRECDAFLFAKHREAFEEHVSTVVPPLDTLARAHDRLHLAEEAAAAGVPVARTRPLSAVEEWDADVVIKSRYNLLTEEYVDTAPPDTVAEVKTVQFLAAGDEPDERAVQRKMRHDPIVQDYVPQSRKHLYCALWEDGEPVSTYQHRQIRQNSCVGGGGVYRVSAFSQTVEDAAYDLLSHLEWTGFACIEYLQDRETGEWKFLEINPRVWQSMPEAVRAGVDFPHHYWTRARGDDGIVDDDYETGIACHNSYGEVAHLLSILRDDSPFVERPSFLRTLGEVVTSCIRHPRFDYLRRDDPRLFASALRSALSTGVTSSREYASGDASASTSRPDDADPDTAEDPTRQHRTAGDP